MPPAAATGWFAWLALGLILGLAGVARAGTVAARFRWEGDRPRLALEVEAAVEQGAEAATLRLPLTVQAVGADPVLWSTVIEVPLAGPAPWRTEVEIEGMGERQGRYRLELRGRQPALAVDYRETLVVERFGATLPSYGLRENGVFPEHAVFFTFSVVGFRTAEQRELPVSLQVTDADNNLVVDTLATVLPGRETSWHSLEVTPRGPDEPAGPFRFEAAIDSDAHGLHFRTTESFAWANARVPVSSFEDGRPGRWFAAHGTPPTTTAGRGFYYSPQLGDFNPASEPRLDYDAEIKHSGTRALRVDYLAGQGAYVWSRCQLPGKPTILTVWVKGNRSGDRLQVTFEDNINYSRPGWGRNAAFATETICTLDFDDWRLFRVPVLGAGQQQDSFAGSSDQIDAPIAVTAFRLEPGARRPADAPVERRTIWIGEVGAETQVRTEERLSLELRIDDPAGRLRADDALTVCVGNGWSRPLPRGRLQVQARDGAGETVYTANHELAVAANSFAVARLGLDALVALRPRGPVAIEVNFLDPSVPGARRVGRLTLKAPEHGGLFLDFAEPTLYSGYEPGKVVEPASQIVALPGEGGAALALAFAPDQSASALLHPALPGQVVSVTLRVRAVGAAAVLQPWFIDSGQTGVSNRPYNLFWAPAATVEPTADWQELTFEAPPIPAAYDDPRLSFLFEPWYPLNLAMRATARDEGLSGTLLVDQVRLVTHLQAAQAVTGELVHADDTHLHAPGSALALALRNFGPSARAGELAFTLRNSQGRRVAERRLEVSLPAGAKQRLVLVDSLAPGIYQLEAAGLDGLAVEELVTVVDAGELFGAAPLEALRDPVGLRLRLGLERQPVYLDWDNSEPAPGAYEFGWFESEVRRQTAEHRLRAVPVLGFSADWAGPEAAEAVTRGDYLRYIANLYQTPARTVDWGLFVREALREFGDQFDEYVFWENPDVDESPQHVPPARYAELFRPFERWVRLYAPGAKVTIGGFNYDRALAYLDRLEGVAELPFDRLAVQMNIGELSPEGADIEGFFDDLDRLLDLRGSGREVQATQCDWGIGPLLSPIEHAAYHARTLMILASRGARRHSFGLVNSGYTFAGHGIFHRLPYGNSEELQHLKPFHLPKPAFLALTHVGRLLETHRFVRAVEVPDLCRDRNRVFVYQDDAGRLRLAFWRAAGGARHYRLPERWAAAPVEDAFGFPVPTGDGQLSFTPLPYLLTLPEGETLDQVVHTLRHLPAVDGSFPVWLELHPAEADSARRAEYRADGSPTPTPVAGRLPGRTRRRQETILAGLQAERFVFDSPVAGMALLTRLWQFQAGGQQLFVQLNDEPEMAWDLTSERPAVDGLRESTFVLRKVVAGRNRVAIRYTMPGNSAGYRVEPLPAAEAIDLSRWGVLHTQQSHGDMLLHQSAVGTPLRLADRHFETGFGAHATSLIELPLDGQFRALEVTVGIDAHTQGRGTARFRIFVDDREVANSGLRSGLGEPLTLRVDDLAGARRLLLSLTDAEDGEQNDLGNWVDGRLFLRETGK